MSVSEYLAVKPEDHEVSVLRQECRADGVHAITLGGFTWDFEDEIPRNQEGELRFSFEGVRENTLSVGSRAKDIGLSFEHPILWDYGPTGSIFGNAPLPDPPKFYFDFHNLVSYRLGVPRNPNTYLNFSSSLDEWLQFVYSRTFQLLGAPMEIASKAAKLLEAQAADFTLLPDEAKEHPTLAVLFLGNSWIVFEKGGVVRQETSEGSE